MLDESIFKAYDVRGVYPESLDEGVASDIGRAFVAQLDLSGSRVVVARDMRLSGEALEKAFIQGVTEAGADVLDLGLVSTDALYFAVGHLEEPGGAMVTASVRSVMRSSRESSPTPRNIRVPSRRRTSPKITQNTAWAL